MPGARGLGKKPKLSNAERQKKFSDKKRNDEVKKEEFLRKQREKSKTHLQSLSEAKKEERKKQNRDQKRIKYMEDKARKQAVHINAGQDSAAY